ncbi:MAG: hypothetical protein ACRDYV_03075, partial [Acidimicrobiia bacterium]
MTLLPNRLLPLRPPTGEIVTFGPGGPRTIQRGVEYSRSWVTGCTPPPQGTPAVPWPEAVAVEDGACLFLSFGDVPHPDYVEVRVYGPETGEDGRPARTEALSVLECRLSEPRREKRIRR